MPKPNPNANPTTMRPLITATAITRPSGDQGDQLGFRPTAEYDCIAGKENDE